MGANVSHDKYPKQGSHVGRRVAVCFNYDTSRQVFGWIVRHDAEEPHQTIIALDDTRFILDTECQYRILDPEPEEE